MLKKSTLYQKTVLLIVVGICLFVPAACADGTFLPDDIAAMELETEPDDASVCLDDAPGAETPPREVAGLHLSGQVKGEEATAVIEPFLGTNYRIIDTEIITYSGSPDELVFWIAEFHDEEEALSVINEMKHYLESSLFFCEHECWSNDNCEIYYARFTGKDIPLEHAYYYREANKVYWVSISSEKPLELLMAFVGKV